MTPAWIAMLLALQAPPPPPAAASVDAQSQLQAGHQYLQEKKYQKALIAYSQILKAEPEHFAANLGRARALIGLGDGPKALGPARLATDLRPQDAPAWMVLGDAYAHPGTQDYPRAAQAYRQALDLDPRSLEAATSLARALSYQKEVEQAIRVLEEVRRHHPGDPGLLTKLAESYYAVRELDRAEKLVNQVLEADPEHAEARRVQEQIRGRKAYNLWVPIIAIVAFPLIIIVVRWMKKGREVKA